MIRPATPEDGAALAAIYAPAVDGAATSFERDPPDAAEMAARVASVVTFTPWLVLEQGGAIVGYAYASRHKERWAYQWSVDTAIYVAPGHHRSGVGRALYAALFPILRRQGFFVAHAGITLPNEGSVRLHESFGFQPIGVYPAVGWKLGAWRDVGWWRLALREPAADPAPPVPYPSLYPTI